MSTPFGSDPWLDARLRNVPLPAGFLAHLSQLGKEPAESGEAAAGPKLFRPNQPVPVGPTLADEQMDTALQNVVVPAGLCGRLERISLESRPRFAGRTLALAASVLIAVGLGLGWRTGYFGGIGADNPASSGELAAVDRTVEGDSSTTTVPSLDEPTEIAADGLNPTDEDAQRAIEDLRWQLAKAANLPIYVPDDVAVPHLTPAPRVNKKSVFAADRTFDVLPELEAASLDETPRGITPPLVPGYDFRFRARYGQSPFVVPAAHKDLQTLRVPLVTGAASYQKAWQALADRKLLPPDEVCVEEFLAALDYEFAPSAPGTLAIRTAGGPAPFAPAGMKLLQVGVKAGSLESQNRPGTLLTVLVDTSASMKRGGSLAMVRRALADVAAQMGEADRLSLVASSDDARQLVDAAGRENLSAILAAIETLEPQLATNVGAGLELAGASSLRQTAPAGGTRRLILITDGLADLADETAARIETLAAEVAAGGVALQVLRIGGSSVEADQGILSRIASKGGGSVLVARDADAVRFSLLESLTGRSQIVAREASLRIQFNPQAVAAYRLLGHETVTLTGSTAGPSAIDFRSGEVATALVEVRLSAQGGDEVGTVELTWLDAATGEQRLARQRISRLQFAKSFAESPLTLQSAAIAAQTAEVLRGSYFAGSGKSLGPVLDLAATASPLVVERPSMQAFLAFVERAESVRLRGHKR